MKKNYDVPMIDIHNHILFGVDDGAQDLRTSLEMIDIAHEDGIRGLILTPHCHPHRGMSSYEKILSHFEELKKVASAQFPDMNLYLGREVYFRSDVLEEVEGMDALQMCGNKIALIEFSSNVQPSYIKSSIADVQMQGLIPIVAHVERYACTIEDKSIVEEFSDMGAFIQINADDLVGNVKNEMKKVVKYLLKNDLVDFVASDAHDTERRRPLLSDAYRYIAKKYGEDYAYDLMYANPMRIIEDKL